jgi:GntR family transcriptional regulator
VLRINPSDAVPIWKQIQDGLRHLIALGTLPTGSPVPSVRDLARELEVNPATVSRAYQHLTEAGLLTVRRGEGTFVSVNQPLIRKTERQQALKEAAARYALVAASVGADEEEAINELEAAWSRIARSSKGVTK